MELYNDSKNVSSSWTYKHKPTCISEVIGNKKAIDTIIEWLNKFEENKTNILEKRNNKIKKKPKKKELVLDKHKEDLEKELVMDTDLDLDKDLQDDDIPILSQEDITYNAKKDISPSLIVTGDHGIGKTCSIFTLLTEMKYTIYTINFSKIKSLQNILDLIEKINSNNNVYNMMHGIIETKKILVIDELETLCSRTEHACILNIIKNNEETWQYPIILISDNKHTKFISDLKKKSIEVKYYKPWSNEITVLFKRISQKENLKFYSSYLEQKIISWIQQDLRRLVYILQDLKTVYNDEVITDRDINNYISMSKTKDLDFHLFKTTELVLSNYVGLTNMLNYHELSKVDIPLMMHQWYVKTLNLHCPDDKLTIDTCFEIAQNISKGDVVENYIHSNQSWNLYEIHGSLTCVTPSYLINKNTNDHIFKLPGAFEKEKPYPIDPNKTSLKNINKKNILNVNQYIPHIDIHDILNISQILKYLIDNDKLQDVISLVKEYKLDSTKIETLLKVNKIKFSKISLSSKQKKDLDKINN